MNNFSYIELSAFHKFEFPKKNEGRGRFLKYIPYASKCSILQFIIFSLNCKKCILKQNLWK